VTDRPRFLSFGTRLLHDPSIVLYLSDLGQTGSGRQPGPNVQFCKLTLISSCVRAKLRRNVSNYYGIDSLNLLLSLLNV